MSKKKSRQPAATPTNQVQGNKNKTANIPAAPAQSKQPKKQKNAKNPQPGSTPKVPGPATVKAPSAPAVSPKPSAAPSIAVQLGGMFSPPSPEEVLSPDELTQLEHDCAAWMKELRSMEYSVEALTFLSGRCRTAIARAGADCYEMEDLAQAKEMYEERILENLENLYLISMQRQQMRDAKDIRGGSSKEKKYLPFYNEVSIVVHNGVIYVKTPPLFNRNKHWKGRELVDYYTFISRVVAYKMMEQDDNIPKFFEKNLNLLAVYSRNIPIIPDADNLDTKTVTDAITNSLPGGDAGRYCTFSRASIHSDELPEGAYFSVTEGFTKAPDFWGNFSTLIELFGTK